MWRWPCTLSGPAVALFHKVLDMILHFPYTPIMASRPQPIPIHDHALDNLRFIRATMERAGAFTAVSGGGGIAMGGSALLAAGVAIRFPDYFLLIWMLEAAIALLIGGIAMARKARRMQVSLASVPARKFSLGFLPPLFAGAVLSIALLRAGVPQLLHGVWICMYGVSVLAGGAYSVRIVPAMGVGFMAFGVGALLTPASWANLWLAASFGGLHIVFGAIIGRRYGG